ncbi:putative tubulin polyglutamylase TTLL4 [Blattamonas nauphoetae]|uniref:Tubulin--tyrosine ligase-like protein 5 n=1 Tax=Blattamonas nauphoetae TaxID=2049346 RepID=A0ABQ9YLS0_9EUKA|nr:putative tubulin polyglutamylase TTLL4 [Blattamonas nauphoetae]
MSTAPSRKGKISSRMRLCPSIFYDLPPFLIHSNGASVSFFKPAHNSIPPTLKTTSQCPEIVRAVYQNGGIETEKTDQESWIGLWGRLTKSEYLALHPFNRSNHFPCTFELGRKDNLHKHLMALASRSSPAHCNFFPKTYIFPRDVDLFRKDTDGVSTGPYIIKPVAASRGIGIHVVNSAKEVECTPQTLAQEYIANPFLIDGYKFDLRLYIVVMGYDPLRLYLYRDGIVRFASQKYDAKSTNQFAALTNFSINKARSDLCGEKGKGWTTSDDSQWLEDFFDDEEDEDDESDDGHERIQHFRTRNEDIETENANEVNEHSETDSPRSNALSNRGTSPASVVPPYQSFNQMANLSPHSKMAPAMPTLPNRSNLPQSPSTSQKDHERVTQLLKGKHTLKWRLSDLRLYLRYHRNVDDNVIMRRIHDVLIKTFIAADETFTKELQSTLRYPQTCTELYGVDIMLDSNCRPWIVEINTSPSMNSGSEIDEIVKGNMLSDFLTLQGNTPICHQKKGKADAKEGRKEVCINLVGKDDIAKLNSLLIEEKGKRQQSEDSGTVHPNPPPSPPTENGTKSPSPKPQKPIQLSSHPYKVATSSHPVSFLSYPPPLPPPSFNTLSSKTLKISKLPPHDLALLRIVEGEFSRRGGFQRIFPTPFNWNLYSQFFQTKHYSDTLVGSFLQQRHERTCGAADSLPPDQPSRSDQPMDTKLKCPFCQKHHNNDPLFELGSVCLFQPASPVYVTEAGIKKPRYPSIWYLDDEDCCPPGSSSPHTATKSSSVNSQMTLSISTLPSYTSLFIIPILPTPLIPDKRPVLISPAQQPLLTTLRASIKKAQKNQLQRFSYGKRDHSSPSLFSLAPNAEETDRPLSRLRDRQTVGPNSSSPQLRQLSTSHFTSRQTQPHVSFRPSLPTSSSLGKTPLVALPRLSSRSVPLFQFGQLGAHQPSSLQKDPMVQSPLKDRPLNNTSSEPESDQKATLPPLPSSVTTHLNALLQAKANKPQKSKSVPSVLLTPPHMSSNPEMRTDNIEDKQKYALPTITQLPELSPSPQKHTSIPENGPAPQSASSPFQTTTLLPLTLTTLQTSSLRTPTPESKSEGRLAVLPPNTTISQASHRFPTSTQSSFSAPFRSFATDVTPPRSYQTPLLPSRHPMSSHNQQRSLPFITPVRSTPSIMTQNIRSMYPP